MSKIPTSAIFCDISLIFTTKLPGEIVLFASVELNFNMILLKSALVASPDENKGGNLLIIGILSLVVLTTNLLDGVSIYSVILYSR